MIAATGAALREVRGDHPLAVAEIINSLPAIAAASRIAV
jgi:hypothetical protein